MRDASMRQLQILVSLAKNLSFTRAAQALYLTQPAVSMQIKALEGLAGVPLVERVGRQVALTQAGTRILHYAQAVLRSLDDAEEDLTELRGLQPGMVTISGVSRPKYF